MGIKWTRYRSNARGRRRLLAVVGASAVMISGAAVAVSGAGAAAGGQRLSGFGQRVGEYLTVDVRIANGGANGIVVFGFLDGSATCTYKSFSNAEFVNATTVMFYGSGTCTYTQPGWAHVFAHHRFAIDAGSDTADVIDVNNLPDSQAGITLPGGSVEAGNYTLH